MRNLESCIYVSDLTEQQLHLWLLFIKNKWSRCRFRPPKIHHPQNSKCLLYQIAGLDSVKTQFKNRRCTPTSSIPHNSADICCMSYNLSVLSISGLPLYCKLSSSFICTVQSAWQIQHGWRWGQVIVLSIFYSISFILLSVMGAGAYPTCQWVKGGIHHGQITSLH